MLSAKRYNCKMFQCAVHKDGNRRAACSKIDHGTALTVVGSSQQLGRCFRSNQVIGQSACRQLCDTLLQFIDHIGIDISHSVCNLQRAADHIVRLRHYVVVRHVRYSRHLQHLFFGRQLAQRFLFQIGQHVVRQPFAIEHRARHRHRCCAQRVRIQPDIDFGDDNRSPQTVCQLFEQTIQCSHHLGRFANDAIAHTIFWRRFRFDSQHMQSLVVNLTRSHNSQFGIAYFGSHNDIFHIILFFLYFHN